MNSELQCSDWCLFQKYVIKSAALGLQAERLISYIFSFQVGRFSHTASLYLDAMVLFGGELQDGNLTNDLWLYNLTLNEWTELAVNDTDKPPPLAEHTATVVDDKLYIFGGEFLVTCTRDLSMKIE